MGGCRGHGQTNDTSEVSMRVCVWCGGAENEAGLAKCVAVFPKHPHHTVPVHTTVLLNSASAASIVEKQREIHYIGRQEWPSTNNSLGSPARRQG